ncbi:MAG: fatty acid desaturase family protein [Pirellula sp.]
MDVSTLESGRFSMRQAKELVRDLQQPIAWIYWTDFLATILAGHALFALNANSHRWLTAAPAPLAIATKLALFAATILLFLRAAMFTHELVHLPKQGWTAFRIAWNLLCGIPFLIPSFTYYPHIDHHRRKSYATEDDGEYLNLSHQPPRAIVLYMLAIVITPSVGLARFAILSPICWVLPHVRHWTFTHASTMVMDITYRRPEAARRVMRIVLLQEAACFAVCVYLLLHGWFWTGPGIDPLWTHAYAVSLGLIFLNNVRTLGSHRWTGPGSELTFEEQLLDSCDYPYRPWLTELWGPTGTRYHATHHLFPGIPYHNLGIAHRRLMAGLPENSIYRETVRVSLLREIAALWKRSAQCAAAEHNSEPATILPFRQTKPSQQLQERHSRAA